MLPLGNTFETNMRTKSVMMDMTMILSACALASCAAPDVVRTGPNTYLIARSSAAGAFTNASKLRAETIREANTYAASKGKIAEGISSNFERPLQGFPTFEYQFRLVGTDAAGSNRAVPSETVKIQHE